MGKISSFITFCLSGLLGIGAVAAVSYAMGVDYGSNNKDEIVQISEDESVIDEQGIKLKRLSINTLENGDVVQTFTYSFEKNSEEDVLNESIDVRSYYQDDGSDASTLISVSKNEETKTITVTNIGGQAFDRVVIVEVKSLADEKVKALVTIKYQKKLLDLSFDHDSREPYLATDTTDIRQLILDYSNENNVSTYTLDFNYSEVDVSSLEINLDNFSVSLLPGEVGASGSFEDYENFDAVEPILPELEEIFRHSIESSLRDNIFQLNEVIPNINEIWELENTNPYHNFLKSYCDGNLGFRFNLSGSTLTLEDTQTVLSSDEATFTIYLHYDFTNFNLAPSNINVSTPELIY